MLVLVIQKVVSITLSSPVKRGPGQYIFNNTLLENLNFVNGARDIINDYINSFVLFDSFRIVWDFMKLTIRDYAICYSIERSKERKQLFLRQLGKSNQSKPFQNRI